MVTFTITKVNIKNTKRTCLRVLTQTDGFKFLDRVFAKDELHEVMDDIVDYCNEKGVGCEFELEV